MKIHKDFKMKYILMTGIIVMLMLDVSCSSGSTGTLMGRILDGFGNPLGGPGVRVTLSGNPAYTNPDQWGNFIVHAPIGQYTMTIAFTNPAAGFNFHLDENVTVFKGSQNLGEFTLLNVQNMDAWEQYRNGDYQRAISKFNEQAAMARGGQVWLPYMRIIEGEIDENTLLTQGILSAENGLGWCYSRGLGDTDEGRIHYEMGMSGGYKNYDAMVGLAGIALGDGDGQTALDYLEDVIELPGLYDSSQIHDNVKEIDLKAAKSLAEFLLGMDGISMATANEIADEVEANGNAGSRDLLRVLNEFR